MHCAKTIVMNNFHALKIVLQTTIVLQIPPTVILAVNSCLFTSEDAEAQHKSMILVLAVSRKIHMADRNHLVDNQKK